MAQIRRSRAEWLKLIHGWRGSGKTAEQFCSKLGIRPATLKWWAWKIDGDRRAAPATTALVPVTVAPRLVAPVGMFEVELRDVRCRFETGTDPGYVAAVTRAIAASDVAW